MHPSHISVRITCPTQEGLERGVQLVPTKFPTKDYNHIPIECTGMREVALAAKRRQGGTQQVLPTVVEKMTSEIHNPYQELNCGQELHMVSSLHGKY